MKWKPLVIRETDLLERYLKLVGYHKMFGSLSQIRVDNYFVVNRDGLNYTYDYIPEAAARLKIYLKEYRAKHLDKLSSFWKKAILALQSDVRAFKKDPSVKNFHSFVSDYYIGRGIVYYTEALSKILERQKLNQDQSKLEYWHELAETETSKAWDNIKSALPKQVDFSNYLPAELEGYFKNKKKVSYALLKQRKKYYVLHLNNGTIKFYLGKKAEQVEKKELRTKKDIIKADSLKGQIASKGFVKGRVRIVNTNDQMKAMKKGEVLVSIMTTPRLIAAARKAKAIVTDEGGITSHAAIVAREMKKPCVIGTRFATKIFKDGDMVEVDANNGIVRKI